MKIENPEIWGFGLMATPQFDPGDAGYVAASSGNIISPHGDAGDVGGYGYIAPGIIEPSPWSVLGGFAILAFGAWLLLKR